jgi:hypothetical protein
MQLSLDLAKILLFSFQTEVSLLGRHLLWQRKGSKLISRCSPRLRMSQMLGLISAANSGELRIFFLLLFRKEFLEKK